MPYLHDNGEQFLDAVNLASERYHVLPIVVEKDYYVTMILRGLSERLDYIVFKGGTSLSKCHRIIRRFSEDIDITIDTRLSQGQMKKLKTAIIEIAGDIGLNIPNIDDTRSRRSYNRYVLEYKSVVTGLDDSIKDGSEGSHDHYASPAMNAVQTAVLLETSFAEVSFPTVVLPVHSYIGNMMADEAPTEVDHYRLEPFDMKVQGVDRTLADKVFAICDYYLQGRVKKHSRHIYDIFKLLPLVPQNEDFRALVREVRGVRAMTNICPSAQPGVNVPELLKTIVENGVYREDYEGLTIRLLEEDVSYSTAIEAVKLISCSGVFEE